MRQKQKNNFSLRLACVGGTLTAENLKKIAEVAEKYGDGYVHLTSRQGVEIPFIKLDDIDDVKDDLAKGGCKPGVCGPRVRTVTACQGNAVCPSGNINSYDIAVKLNERYFGRELPHKFKFGVTGCQNNCLKAEENDVGIKGGIKVAWQEDKCIQCGVCVKACRESAITLENGKITVDEVEKYFEEDGLSQEQMNLVCDYLLSMKMAVVGYKQTGGTVKEAEKEEKQPLSAEEQKYVEEYLRGLGDMKEETQEEVRMAYYLPKVVEEAVRLHHPEVFIGDMIQEGNIALMVALKEIPKEKDEEEILEQVRAGMMASLESQTEVKRRDHKMVEKVTELDEAIKSMKEEYGRKVSVDEVAERLGISEDEIEDILKLAGEEVKDEE